MWLWIKKELSLAQYNDCADNEWKLNESLKIYMRCFIFPKKLFKFITAHNYSFYGVFSSGTLLKSLYTSAHEFIHPYFLRTAVVSQS